MALARPLSQRSAQSSPNRTDPGRDLADCGDPACGAVPAPPAPEAPGADASIACLCRTITAAHCSKSDSSFFRDWSIII